MEQAAIDHGKIFLFGQSLIFFINSPLIAMLSYMIVRVKLNITSFFNIKCFHCPFVEKTESPV